jgi:hypothetical protein
LFYVDVFFWFCVFFWVLFFFFCIFWEIVQLQEGDWFMSAINEIGKLLMSALRWRSFLGDNVNPCTMDLHFFFPELCLFFLNFVNLLVCDEYNEQIHVDDEQIYGFCCFLNFFLIFWIFFKNKYVKPLGMPHQDSI